MGMPEASVLMGQYLLNLCNDQVELAVSVATCKQPTLVTADVKEAIILNVGVRVLTD